MKCTYSLYTKRFVKPKKIENIFAKIQTIVMGYTTVLFIWSEVDRRYKYYERRKN